MTCHRAHGSPCEPLEHLGIRKLLSESDQGKASRSSNGHRLNQISSPKISKSARQTPASSLAASCLCSVTDTRELRFNSSISSDPGIPCVRTEAAALTPCAEGKTHPRHRGPTKSRRSSGSLQLHADTALEQLARLSR